MFSEELASPVIGTLPHVFAGVGTLEFIPGETSRKVWKPMLIPKVALGMF
jgi:hypothetical protein